MLIKRKLLDHMVKIAQRRCPELKLEKMRAFLRSVICKLDKYVYSDTNDTLVEEHKE